MLEKHLSSQVGVQPKDANLGHHTIYSGQLIIV